MCHTACSNDADDAPQRLDWEDRTLRKTLHVNGLHAQIHIARLSD